MRVVGGFVVAIGLMTAGLIALAMYFVQSLGRQVAEHSGQAMREQARASLERITHEQARRYREIFHEAVHRSRILARRAEHQVGMTAEREPAFPLDLRWHAEQALHANSPNTAIALFHWGSQELSATARRDMRWLTHLQTNLQRASEEVTGAAAAWIATESGGMAYAPNRAPMEPKAADGAELVNAPFYRVATPEQAPQADTQWTDPYEDPAGQGIVVTAATPIHGPEGERFVGVAGVDLTLEGLAERILSQDPLDLQASSQGDGRPLSLTLLMDGQTRPVALEPEHHRLLGLTPTDDLQPGEMVGQALRDSSQPSMRRAVRRAADEQTLVVKNLHLSGREYLAVFQAVPTTDWVLANLVAEQALVRPATSTRREINDRITGMVGGLAVVTLLMLVLMSAGLLAYFRWAVIRPISRLMTAAERMRSGDYRVAVPRQRNDELGDLAASFTDLSERLADLIDDLENRVQERTREADTARDHFRSILNSSPVGIAFVDDQRCIQRVNPAFEELLGWSAEQLQGRDTSLFYQNPSEFERAGREAYPLIAGGGVYRTVVNLAHADGTSLTVSLTGQAVDASARAGYIWVLQDITEQRAREKALQTYQAVFEYSRDAVQLDAEDGFLDCNPATLALFEVPDRTTFIRDYTAEELSPPYQPDGRSSEQASRAYTQEAFEQGRVLFEWEYRTATGRTFPAEVLLSRVDLEDGPILECNARDISEKKAAFEDLRAARDRAELYFEAVPVMVFVLDTQGRVSAINRRGCELLGLAREAIVGSNWFDRFVASDKADRMQEVFEALQGDRDSITEYVEHTVLTAAGEHRMIVFRSALLRNAAGQVEGLLASGTDMTEQRQLEAELEYRASHDPLTGIYNRRRMHELVDGEMRRARRYGTAFSAILFDIDHFKSINDHHGHVIGDAVLQELTAAVAQRLRDVDSVARWGGEEFLVLLPETHTEGAQRVAEDLRDLTATTEFAERLHVTISLGVATATHDEGIEGLLKRLDANLYLAKDGGRNRIA